MLDKTLLEVIVCPHCKGPLNYEQPQDRLVCVAEKLAYPICDGIPVLLVEEAIDLSQAPPRNQSTD